MKEIRKSIDELKRLLIQKEREGKIKLEKLSVRYSVLEGEGK